MLRPWGRRPAKPIEHCVEEREIPSSKAGVGQAFSKLAGVGIKLAFTISIVADQTPKTSMRIQALSNSSQETLGGVWFLQKLDFFRKGLFADDFAAIATGIDDL